MFNVSYHYTRVCVCVCVLNSFCSVLCTCIHVCSSVRMKEQVKSRMEVLLEQEIQSRQLSSSVTADRSPEPVSRTGQMSLTASTASRAAGSASTTTALSQTARGGVRVSAKADLVFSVETGTHVYSFTYTQTHILSLPSPPPPPPPLIPYLFLISPTLSVQSYYNVCIYKYIQVAFLAIYVHILSV